LYSVQVIIRFRSYCINPMNCSAIQLRFMW